MTFLYVILGALLVGGAFVAYKKTQSSGDKKALPAPGVRTPLTIQVGDIVSHFTTDYLVEGKLTYSEEGDEWYDFMLVDGDDVVWLSVEEDDRLEVGLYREVSDLKFTSKPPEYINHEGTQYELEEWGRAKVSRIGATGSKKAGMFCVYYEYEAPGDRYLTVEQWGEGEFEVSIGKPIRPSELDILPGNGVV